MKLRQKLASMNKAQLIELCHKEDLSKEGPKKDLIDRLILKKIGSTKHHVFGKTKCCICGALVRVKNTKTEIVNGKLLIVRQIQCTGKHCHKYPLKELKQID